MGNAAKNRRELRINRCAPVRSRSWKSGREYRSKKYSARPEEFHRYPLPSKARTRSGAMTA